VAFHLLKSAIDRPEDWHGSSNPNCCCSHPKIHDQALYFIRNISIFIADCGLRQAKLEGLAGCDAGTGSPPHAAGDLSALVWAERPH
jgi:hypothetical protein